ncbi:hypothetical protein FOPG_19295, partial [Fusarium oxysporum f. sp. conglutinans race 2 54008]
MAANGLRHNGGAKYDAIKRAPETGKAKSLPM